MNLRISGLASCALFVLASATGALADPPVTLQTTYRVVPLGPVSSTGDSGKAVNSSGVVAFTKSTSVYLYNNGTITPAPGVAAGGGPLAMNDSGDLTGTNGGAFLYKNGSLQTITYPNSQYTNGYGINNSDVIVGYEYNSSANAYRAFSWQNGTFTNLPGPAAGYSNGNESRAYAISNNGQIAGSYDGDNPGGSAAVWNSPTQTPTLLPTPNGYSRSEANAINNNGDTVGYTGDSTLQTILPVAWIASAPQVLSLPTGLRSGFATSLNDSDEVVGYAFNLSDQLHGKALAWGVPKNPGECIIFVFEPAEPAFHSYGDRPWNGF